MAKRIAYLGPKGTYTEEAATRYDPAASLVSCSTITASAQAVVSREADEAVLPIENSLGGAVAETLDLLIHQSELQIRGEIVLPIHHCIMAKHDTNPADVTVVYSHTQSLAQCRGYLAKNYPNARLVASLSNSAAVGEMQTSEDTAAAIAGRRAAELYKANILDLDIEDNPSNATRFIVMAHTDSQPTGTDKTSLCFDFDSDAPGTLVIALGEFSNRGINLNKIESRPTRMGLGRYIFLVDINGHRQDAKVADALDALRGLASMLKVLGSYPREVSSSI
jgi:prephenate dehydratase